MRNLGLFTPVSVFPDEVEQFVIARGGTLAVYGISPTLRNTIIGANEDLVYVASDTAVSSACFDKEELQSTGEQLGFAPKAYISLHFSWTAKAFDRAEGLAVEMRQLWGGVIDYSAAGGGLGLPPAHRA